MNRIAALALACSFLAATPSVAANLIVNGSFETPVIPVGTTTNYPAGSTAITGWTVVGVDSSLVSGSFVQSGITFQAQAGVQWLDLAGFNSNSMASGVTQNIATTIGQPYQIDFYVGSAKDNNFFDASSVDLSINGGPRTRFTNPTTPSNMLNWQLFTVPFVATSGTTNLTFFNGSAANNFLGALDNVVVDAVPEPPTIALLAAGVLAVLLRRFWENRSRARFA